MVNSVQQTRMVISTFSRPGSIDKEPLMHHWVVKNQLLKSIKNLKYPYNFTA